MTENTNIDPVKDFLDYYKKLDNPGYAVLVTGDWGSGKTYRVNEIFKADNPIYVSLFGLNSVEEIYMEVLSIAAPEAARAVKFKNAAKDKNAGFSFLGFGITFPFGAFVAAPFNGNIRRKIDNSRTIIFDDLERSRINPTVLLGMVNFYVEHCFCRVVVIANDKKMLSEFADTKEKIFGQTIRVKPKFDEVFELTVKTYPERDRKIIHSRSTTIKNFFIVANCESMRILQRVLNDLVRFQNLFDPKQIENSERFEPLFELFLALDIDIRSGALVREDLNNRHAKTLNKIAKKMGGGPAETAEVRNDDRFLRRHKIFSDLTDISNSLLADEHLVSMLADGIYDRDSIQDHFKSISYFAVPSDQPAWLRFMQFDKNDDSIVNAAAAEMDARFKKHEIENVGEFLHIVALRFLRSEKRFIGDDFEKISSDAKLYLDEWVNNGNFPISDNSDSYDHFGGYGGFGFWINESYDKEFKGILKHIGSAKERAVILFAKSCRQSVMELLVSGQNKFEDELGVDQSNKRVGLYYNIPVLISVDVQDFIDKFSELPLDRRRPIARLLSDRMSRAKYEPSLKPEQEWFTGLLSAMNERSLALGDTLAGFRLKRSIPVEK